MKTVKIVPSIDNFEVSFVDDPAIKEKFTLFRSAGEVSEEDDVLELREHPMVDQDAEKEVRGLLNRKQDRVDTIMDLLGDELDEDNAREIFGMIRTDIQSSKLIMSLLGGTPIRARDDSNTEDSTNMAENEEVAVQEEEQEETVENTVPENTEGVTDATEGVAENTGTPAEETEGVNDRTSGVNDPETVENSDEDEAEVEAEAEEEEEVVEEVEVEESDEEEEVVESRNSDSEEENDFESIIRRVFDERMEEVIERMDSLEAKFEESEESTVENSEESPVEESEEDGEVRDRQAPVSVTDEVEAEENRFNPTGMEQYDVMFETRSKLRQKLRQQEAQGNL